MPAGGGRLQGEADAEGGNGAQEGADKSDRSLREALEWMGRFLSVTRIEIRLNQVAYKIL